LAHDNASSAPWSSPPSLTSTALYPLGNKLDLTGVCIDAEQTEPLGHSQQVGNTAAFLSSPMACAITGTTIYVDHGLHTMGLAVDSPIFAAKMNGDN